MRRKKRFFLLCFALVSTACSLCAAEPLFDNGKSAWQIVTGKNATVTEKWAARELQTYILKTSGVKLPVKMEEAAQAKNRIFVGTPKGCDAIAAAAADLKLRTDDRESLAIVTKGDDLYLAGNLPRAVNYAVFEFLQRHLDVRWFWFDEKGEYIAEKKSFTLPEIDWHYTPDFPYRDLTPVVVGQNIPTETWFMRMGMNATSRTLDVRDRLGFIKMDVSHYCALRDKKVADAHPDWLQELNGERKFRHCNRGCWSNPGLKQYYIDILIKAVQEKQLDVIEVLPADTQQPCQCAKCAANPLDPSARWYAYFMELIPEVRKACPNVKFASDAYHEYKAVPGIEVKGLEYVDYGLYGRCYVHRFDDPRCPRNAAVLDEYRRWKEKAVMGNYEYHFDVLKDGYVYYILPMWNLIENEVKIFRDLGCVRLKEEFVMDYYRPGERGKMAPDSKYSGMPQITNRLAYYITAKLFWDPSLTAAELMEDFCTRVYGPGAKEMKAYYEMLARRWEGMNLHFSGWHHQPKECVREFISPETIVGAHALFDAAEKKVNESGAEEKTKQRQLENIQIEREILGQWEKLYAENCNDLSIDAVELSPGASPENLKRYTASVYIGQKGQPTEFSFYYTKDALHVVAFAKEANMGSYRPGVSGKDHDVRWDDSVEVILVPNEAGDQAIHVNINGSGGYADDFAKDRSWTREWKNKITLLDDGWVMDVTLPFDQIGKKAQKGDCWQIAVNRKNTMYITGYPLGLNHSHCDKLVKLHFR